MWVLIVTSEWPVPDLPVSGVFVKRQVESLRNRGIDVDVFHFRGRKNPFNYLRAWFGARRKQREHPYDLVHAHFGQSGLLALPKRLPLVVTFHGTDACGSTPGGRGRIVSYHKVLNWVSRYVARKADAVIVVSQHMKQYLPNQKPIEVLPSGIDFRMFREIPQREARDRLRLPHEERLVLFAGDPDLAGKRYTLAKQAVQLLKSSMEARLVVAWGVPHRDMPLYMNAADALVLTSMAEGSPNVVKEALACNLPVVAVDVGDVAERIAAVEGCKLCGNDRPGTIAKALEDVLRVKQRVSGRRHVSELDEHILTERLIEIYHQVSSE